MELKDKNIGFCITGSFCTFRNIVSEIKSLVNLGANIIPIMSYTAYNIDSKFGKAKDFVKEIEEITNNTTIHTLQGAEPIGPKHLTDIMIIAPCTGNTLGKLSNGINDSPVLMAAKANLRNGKPLVIAPSTNDGLSGSAENIGRLLNRKNYFFVPFRQDNPISKPRSLLFDHTYIIKTMECALDGEQIQPILL